MQVFGGELLQWDEKKQTAKSRGIFGRVIGCVPASETQCQETVRSHPKLFLEGMNQEIWNKLFSNDPFVEAQAR